jgi:cellulose synthase/poly-beta-1,6-N-acetylglucosamine synthase-like glycosyltransferase
MNRNQELLVPFELEKTFSCPIQEAKKVTIIVPHCPSREDLLPRLLRSIKASEGISIQLLVSEEGNLSECRNKLASKATGDILLFFDDDVELRSDTIAELIQPFYSKEFKNVGVVGGVNIPFKNAPKSEINADALLTSYVTMFRSRARYTPTGNIRIADESEILTCNMAISREAFEDARGFPEDIIPCEENVLMNRIRRKGYSIIYTPFAVVYHRRPKLFKQYARTIFNYGKGRGMMIRNHEGNPRLFSGPKFDWLIIVAGVFVHYCSYISGLIYGYFKGKRK